MGRCGKACRNSAARKGWAAGFTPARDNTSPFSRRRNRSCAAGVFETVANKLPAAVMDESCAKQGKVRGRAEKRNRRLSTVFQKGADKILRRKQRGLPPLLQRNDGGEGWGEEAVLIG